MIILRLIFFIVDNNRVKNNERPIFCIKNPAGKINDGGTVEFFGLGYKVIDFHTLEVLYIVSVRGDYIYE